MKLGSFFDSDSSIISGIIQEDKLIVVNNLYALKATGERPLNQLKITSPVFPSKIIAVGLNYKKHIAEMKDTLPDEPLLFLKANSSILPHGGKIVCPGSTKRLDFEAELAIVIKRRAKNIGTGDVPEHILGFTAFNDVTARDLQAKDGQWARAKSFDTFAPYGPFIETEIKNPQNLRIQSILNGEIKQDSNTSNMIFDIPFLVSYISKQMTLNPGDIIATGTPNGIGPMQPGDRITIRIENLDDLTNEVKEEN